MLVIFPLFIYFEKDNILKFFGGGRFVFGEWDIIIFSFMVPTLFNFLSQFIPVLLNFRKSNFLREFCEEVDLIF